MKIKQVFAHFVLMVAALFWWGQAMAQIEMPEDKVSWKFKVEQDGCDAYIIAEISIVDHWHIYAANLPEGSFTLPTQIKLKKSTEFATVGGVQEPKPTFEHDEMADEDLYYHSGKVKLKRKIKVNSESDFTIEGTFSFQTCDDSHCLPPFSTDFSVKVKGCSDQRAIEESKELEKEFVSVNGDEAKGKDGKDYVRVNGVWYKVPEGNSVGFYKKYLELGGSHEE